MNQHCKIEEKRVLYLRENWEQLRLSDYASLLDMFRDSSRVEDKSNAVRCARLFNLSSKFVRRARYVRQQLHDNTDISNKLGHLYISLTVTCYLN